MQNDLTTETARRTQLRAAADAYFAGFARRDFDAIPYADDVVLRAPLAPGGVHTPLVGRETLRRVWWAPVERALGEVEVLRHYFAEDLSGVCTAAIVAIADSPIRLRVADRFTIDDRGRIVEQENHFDHATSPTRAGGAEVVAPGATAILVAHFRRTYDRVLRVVDDLSEAQLGWRPTPRAHSIGWNLWHLARWTDHLQASVPSMTAVLTERLGPARQIWAADELAAGWGLEASELGQHETGMLMADEVAARLALPTRDVLFDYLRRAFAAAERAIGAIDDVELTRPNALELAGNPSSRLTVGDAVTAHLEHNNRHLGEIECLRGLLGLRGTATQ